MNYVFRRNYFGIALVLMILGFFSQSIEYIALGFLLFALIDGIERSYESGCFPESQRDAR